MRASYHNLLHLVAVGTIAVLSVVLFNPKQAPQKAAITKAEVKLPTEAMTKEWLTRTDESQAKAKERLERLEHLTKGLDLLTKRLELPTKLKEQSGFLAGDQMKGEAKSMAEVAAEVEKATERLKQTKKSLNTYKLPITTSIEFTTPEKYQRIPLGATDPGKLWRSQMHNARATMRDAGIPETR